MPESTTDSSRDNMKAVLQYIAGRKAAEQALGFLVSVSATIRTTADSREVAPAVVKTCVPFLATGFSVDVPAVHGESLVEAPDELVAAVEMVRSLVVATGEPELVISGHERLAPKTDPEHLELIRGLGADSAVAVELNYRGVKGGYLIAVRAEKHRRGAIGPSDVSLAIEVASGLAAFNAYSGGGAAS